MNDNPVIQNKQWRKQLDDILQELQTPLDGRKSRNRSIAITRLEDVIMRLGLDLKELNETNPYPNSKDPTNAKIEPTADGLKF
jgi:hypothetical protein